MRKTVFRFALSCTVVVAFAATGSRAFGAEAEQKYSLSPSQAAEGWLMLFDRESTYGWAARGDYKWKVENGILTCGAGKSLGLRTTSEFSNFTLRVEYRLPAGSKSAILYGMRPPQGAGSPSEPTPRVVEIVGKKGNQWQRAEINAQDVRGCIAIAGVPSLEIRSVLLKPTNMKAIFNGKDLTGWKPVEGAKLRSVFTVTPQGWLNIKDGPGDLQTVEQWKDFCLQLDILSSTTGKALNSGVFFRAEPGKFWQGYEAQIRNEYSGGDRTKPVDFGTGAIYNRLAARKVVADENKWHTMTIVAAHNHIATWVNGYQVADYTDTNPPGSPREKKCRLEAGVISLQGHDPTTNMSFRNIGIQAYPE
ncbi:DUF1080 domain-containing protein [Candidatus Sumerlaeota bacterium]|nr:DUF1080 domain-containing protein [Candidatus Sumerlaeota bacterium]